MEKNTLEEYKKAVKAKYDLVKDSDISGLLSNPSPGNIRELCILVAGEKISKDDESIIVRFFDVKEGENSLRQIEQFDLDKLKPVRNYLKGKTKDTKQIIVELIAILINYTPRPYSKFHKINGGTLIKEKGNDQFDVSLNTEDIETSKKPEKGPVILMFHDKAKANNSISSFFIKQKKAVFFSIVGLFFAGYFAKGFVFPNKDFMVWKEDHYELFDKKNEKMQTLYLNPVPYDEKEFNRKKLTVCDTTTFFKNSRPIVWYSKKDNEVEFFNMDGCHPERADCELRKITPYMIDKYVPHCK